MSQPPIEPDQILDLDASKIVSGTFADARISQSSVTQHQAALVIGGGQISVNSIPTDRLISGGTYPINITGSANSATTSTNATNASFSTTQAPGTNNTTIATTAFVQTAVASATTVTQSPQFAYTGALQLLTWNHGLGVTPKFVGVYIINIVSEGGYTPGQILSLNATLSESDSGGGPQNDGSLVRISSTQVILRVANRRLIALNTGGGHFNPNAGFWNIFFTVLK